MKKQLVIQSIPGERHVDNCNRYLFKKSLWSIEIHYEIKQDVMELLELMISDKITLLDVMEIIKDKSSELIPDGEGDCGYRVFRLKN